jgi:proteasome lid subunit RPN8/RPN11
MRRLFNGAVSEIPAQLLREMIEHADHEAPRESCGLVIGSAPPHTGGVPLRYIPLQNVAQGVDRFEMDPTELLRVSSAADEAGEAIWAIVHAHPEGPPIPSIRDRAGAHHPDALHLIVGRTPEGGHEIRAWQLPDGSIDGSPAGAPREVPITER